MELRAPKSFTDELRPASIPSFAECCCCKSACITDCCVLFPNACGWCCNRFSITFLKLSSLPYPLGLASGPPLCCLLDPLSPCADSAPRLPVIGPSEIPVGISMIPAILTVSTQNVAHCAGYGTDTLLVLPNSKAQRGPDARWPYASRGRDLACAKSEHKPVR
eukprot:2677025-Rhodomonas_salina.3